MSRTYRTEMREVKVLAAETCDGCGLSSEHPWSPLIRVAIEVNEGEEGGKRDEYDYCDDCLMDRAGALAAAGSTAPLVAADTEREKE